MRRTCYGWPFQRESISEGVGSANKVVFEILLYSCRRAVLLNKGGGVAPGMPTSEQQEVSAFLLGDLPPLFLSKS
jgi:hypothetical protein